MTTEKTHEIVRSLAADYPAVVAAMLTTHDDDSNLAETVMDASVPSLGHDDASTAANLARRLATIAGLAPEEVYMACQLTEEQATRWLELFPDSGENFQPPK